MTREEIVKQLPTDIPSNLMMQVISYGLLLGNDCEIIGAKEVPNGEILIHFKKDGQSDYCFRPLIRNKTTNPLLEKTQKIILPPFNPIPRIIKENINGKDNYIVAQATKADILTSPKGQKIYYLRDSLSKSAQKVIDVEEIKVQDNSVDRDLTKPFWLQTSPDPVEVAYYQHYSQSCEKHIIEI